MSDNSTPHLSISFDADQVADFVAMVGGRIRGARQQQGISRRVLSERSGVSQRYLAQLESGTGNISVALLFQVASALNVQAEQLLNQTNTTEPEASEFFRRFNQSTADQKRQALDALAPVVDADSKQNRICLIGLRGAGKSTLGKRLAEELDTEFLELNQLVEEQSGMPVSELIALYGQEGFRQLERQALETVVETNTSLILAVGGGIVSETETYGRLLQKFYTVWLKALPEEHMERVRKQGDERPMAGNPKAMDELRSILTSREDLYRRADGLVDTSHRSPDESLIDLITTTRQLIGS
ncbi:MAG: helix-turn-helix domain-containing protein [Rhizobiaceae bacterium]|nr:helix-turn-helix domain-containing protein [Rhizobiaceae bacterium]